MCHASGHRRLFVHSSHVHMGVGRSVSKGELCWRNTNPGGLHFGFIHGLICGNVMSLVRALVSCCCG